MHLNHLISAASFLSKSLYCPTFRMNCWTNDCTLCTCQVMVHTEFGPRMVTRQTNYNCGKEVDHRPFIHTSEAQYNAHFQSLHWCPMPLSNSIACNVLVFPFLRIASTEGNWSNPPKGQRVAALHGWMQQEQYKIQKDDWDKTLKMNKTWYIVGVPAQQNGKAHMPLLTFQL